MLILKSPARNALVSLAGNYQKIFSSPEQQAKREKARTFLRDHAGLTDRQIETIYTIAVDKIAP